MDLNMFLSKAGRRVNEKQGNGCEIRLLQTVCIDEDKICRPDSSAEYDRLQQQQHQLPNTYPSQRCCPKHFRPESFSRNKDGPCLCHRNPPVGSSLQELPFKSNVNQKIFSSSERRPSCQTDLPNHRLRHTPVKSKLYPTQHYVQLNKPEENFAEEHNGLLAASSGVSAKDTNENNLFGKKLKFSLTKTPSSNSKTELHRSRGFHFMRFSAARKIVVALESQKNKVALAHSARLAEYNRKLRIRRRIQEANLQWDIYKDERPACTREQVTFAPTVTLRVISECHISLFRRLCLSLKNTNCFKDFSESPLQNSSFTEFQLETS